jgi:translin
MNNLDSIAESIHVDFSSTNERRDAALKQSHSLIRRCSEFIRSVHRHKWADVEQQLGPLHEAANELRASVDGYPMLEHTGYTQDALKEYVEALIVLSMVRGDDDLPTPESLGVLSSTYLNGLAEAASEMRRHILDLLRNDDMDEVKRLLDVMDTAYTVVFSFGYPDAVTGGLRRRVDQLRGVLERTRGDVTTSIRQERMLSAMRELEARLKLED